jgi:hypothetical protein
MVYLGIMSCITPEERETLLLVGLPESDITELELLGRERVVQLVQSFKDLQVKWGITDTDLRRLAAEAEGQVNAAAVV